MDGDTSESREGEKSGTKRVHLEPLHLAPLPEPEAFHAEPLHPAPLHLEHVGDDEDEEEKEEKEEDVDEH